MSKKNKIVNKIRKSYEYDLFRGYYSEKIEKEEKNIEEMMIRFFEKGNTDQEIYRLLGFTYPKEDFEWIAETRREFNKRQKVVDKNA